MLLLIPCSNESVWWGSSVFLLFAFLTRTRPRRPFPVCFPHPQAFIYDLFDRFTDKLLAGCRKLCKEAMPSVDVNRVSSAMHLLTALTHPSQGLNLAAPELDESTKIALQYIFGFR